MALQLPRHKKIEDIKVSIAKPQVGSVNMVKQAPMNFSIAKPQKVPSFSVIGAPSRPRVVAPRSGFNLRAGLDSLAKSPGQFVSGVTDTLVDVARAVPRAVVSTGLQLTGQKEYKPQGGIEKTVLGSQNVPNLAGYQRETTSELGTLATGGKTRDFGSNTPDWLAVPAGFALAATDINPLGGARKKAVKDVAGEITGETVKPRVDFRDVASSTDKTRQVIESTPPKPPVTPVRNEPERIESPVSYRDQQDARQAQYKQKPLVRFAKAFQREAFDPRNIEQRLDARQFRFQKEQGNVRPGQKELLPSESLADTRGRIQNPNRAAAVRDQIKYGVGDDSFSVDDIIRVYGKDDSPVARDFENYRIFKDELERIEKGGNNTLGLDPKMLAGDIARYEQLNPLAVKHNAALRQHQLDILMAKRNARIDDPTLYDNSAQFNYFNPRKALDPEDLIRPKMTGGVRSGAKGTQTRSETAGGTVRSPLSIFKERSVEAERSLAEQQYGLELRQRVREGTVPGAREVVNADVAVQNKQALREMRDLIKRRKSLVTLKRGAQADLGKAKSVAKSEKEAIKFVRKYVNSANENDIFADLKGVDLSDAEALDLFKLMAGKSVKNTRSLMARISKSTGLTPQQVKDYISGIRNAINDTQGDIADARNTASLTSQNLERGTQTYTYKVDGEVGKIELPADLAESLAKQNEAQNLSMLERGLKPIAGAQKLTWTGILQPAFKVWNVLVKNPLLMYRNADGLSGIRPEAGFAILRQVVNTPKMQQFKREMKSRGAAYENILQTKNIQSTTADDIARRAGVLEWAEGLVTNPVQSFQDIWKGVNQVAAFPDNAQRTAVAYGAYKRARDLGFPEDQALDIASKAPAKVFGDFDRISRLAQNMEVLVPYTGAIQAGTRAMYQATKQKPVATTFKDAALLTTMAAATAYSLQNTQEGNDYYQDMIDSGKEYELDNNWTVVLPGASRDPEGNWHGVIKIPLLPDIRPMNRAAWQSTRSLARSEGLDPAVIGGELFNQLTGDTASNLYDAKKGEKNTINGVLPSSPIINAGKTLGGINMYTGDPLANEFMAAKPRVEQAGKSTSEGAKKASQLAQGVLTPQQFDQFFNMTGSTGDILQQKEGSGDVLVNILKPIQPGKGQSKESKSGIAYYKDREKVASTLKNEDDFRAYQTITSKNSVKTVEDSAARAKELLARPAVLTALQNLDARKRSRGETGDPFFDLNPQQQEKVLRYRGAKDLNSAKQAYDKNGNPLFTALGLDEKWYDDYKTKESAYYETFAGKGDSAILTYSGAKKPKASPELEKKLDYYYTLPKGTGVRSAFLKGNPDVLDYWAQGDQFTNAERIAMGLKPVGDEEGGSGGSGSGYGFVRGGGGGGSKGESAKNSRKYAVSINAGTEIAKPKVKAKGGGKAKRKITPRKNVVTMKVTSKKSLV